MTTCHHYYLAITNPLPCHCLPFNLDQSASYSSVRWSVSLEALYVSGGATSSGPHNYAASVEVFYMMTVRYLWRCSI